MDPLMKNRAVVSIILAFMVSPLLAQTTVQHRFQDPSLPVEQRVADIVSRMTFEEKIGQMQYEAPAIPRLGIPAYTWWNECLHGVARNGFATVFPQAIGMAATWNPDLIHREADVIATEARAKHHEAIRQHKSAIYTGLTFWSPNINIFRDPRWGRGQETYGEDPYLTGRIAVAFATGLQGHDPHYFKTISTPKHFAVHSGPEPLRHSFDARTSRADLYDTYLPAFEAAITEGGAWSVMGAYNRYMGEACCASDLLLGKTLRARWGFEGYVVSDCGAIQDIFNGHHVVQTQAEAAALAVRAGCDLTCGNEYASLFEARAKGLVTEEDIDRSVSRLMYARFRLGMFDPPSMVPYASIPISMNDTREHDALARKVAQESIVLLKNEGNVLPLRKDVGTIAVIGPNADDLDGLVGNYNGTPSHPVTLLQGIRNAVAPSTRVLSARGCEYADDLPPTLDPIPNRLLNTAKDGREVHGLTGMYFPNMRLEGTPQFVRVDSVVSFPWGGDSPAPGFPADRFSVRWTGTLTADTTGTYTLGVKIDDGFRLSIDGKMFLEDWHDGSTRTNAKELFLKAGEAHDIRLEFYENSGDAVAELGWKKKSGPLQDNTLAIARSADVVILALGLSPLLEGEEMSIQIKGFSGGDRTDIALPALQESLLEKIVALGKPTVLVLMNGSALAINWAEQHVRGIVEAWYPGQEGGAAIADVLFGDYNPAGRLPVTFYKGTSDLPPFEEYAMKGRTYRYFPGTPLYPFGYGLSYTAFAYSGLTLSTSRVSTSDTLEATLTVRNTGTREGDEIIQVYVRKNNAGADEAITSLRAFKRIHLAGGEARSTTLSLPIRNLRSFSEAAGDYVIAPGKYELDAGASSADIRQRTEFVVTGSR